MKSLKAVIKRVQSPKNTQTVIAGLQPLSSQRSKANSQQIFKKYNHNTPVDVTKNSIIPNKYRIVTQPIDDHMLQLSRSYGKLSKPKKQKIKFESQHHSIKSRQRTISNQKYAHVTQSICPSCQSYEKQIFMIKQEVKKLMNLKDKWKNGQIFVEDFIKDSLGFKKCETLRQSMLQCFDEIRLNLVDLMKDIEVLTQIDYPKLLSHNIFNGQQPSSPQGEETQIKLILQQLREQSEGKVTIWDLQLESGHENFKVIIRNLKTNLMHSLRENLQLRTYNFLPKKEGYVEQDIRKIVFDILRGLKK